MQFSPYLALVILLVAAISVVIVSTFRSIGRRDARRVFVALLLCLVSLIFYGLSLLLRDWEIRYFLHEMKFCALAYLGPCTVFTYLEFVGKGQVLRWRGKLLLCVMPTICIILALTNDAHHLFRAEMGAVLHKGVSYINPTPALWYWIYSAYSYLFFICGVLILFVSLFKMPRTYRDQTGILVATIIAAIALSLASLFKLFDDYGDIALMTCSVVGLGQYVAIVRYSKKRVAARCRSLVLDNMDGTVLIYDHQNRLLDATMDNAEAIRHALEQEDSSFGVSGGELHLPEADRWYGVSERLLYDQKGNWAGRVMLFNDITEQKKIADELEYTATRDYLTGLLNRSAFHAELELLSEADLPVALVYADIANMKLVVSIFGSEYGDRMIVDMAQDFQKLAPHTSPARLHGDEMGFILRQSSKEEAERFIAAAREQVLPTRSDIKLELGYVMLEDLNTVPDKVFAGLANNLRGAKRQARSIRPEMLITLSESLAKLRGKERAERIARLCDEVGELLAPGEEVVDRLRRLAVYADVGLLAADPVLIQSIGNLTNDQWDEMKLHSVRGYRIALSVWELEDIAEDILYHHERYDGYGYPEGLRGDRIPLSARVYAAAEFFADAPPDRARNMLRTRAGSRFDPEVVKALLSLTEKEKERQSVSIEGLLLDGI